MHSTVLRRSLICLSLVSVAACSGAQNLPPAAATPAARPKLVVLIVVDQLRGDMLDRYRADMNRGFARLMNGGAWFINGFQDHGITETAPGHASTLSGRFPSSTGISRNSDGVIDPSYRLLTGVRTERGASPERFSGTTLVDWITTVDPRSRALSVSRKDRGAILPVGRSKQQIYWWSVNGSFTTSTYYRDSLPDWVQAFNNRRILHRYVGGAWSLSRDPASYATPDTVPEERGGRDFLFPHRLPADTAAALAYLETTPWVDSTTALFALEGVNQMGIGRGPQTDVLVVSFSNTDHIGHAYGPDSREAQENQIRLDQTIGWFVDSLYRLRDSSSVMIALTADHGVSPIPELARQRGQAKGEEGLRVNLRSEFAALRAWVKEKGGDTTAMEYGTQTLAIDRARMRAARINPDSVLEIFTRLALRVPGVARVDRMSALRRANLNRDPIARRWTHQFGPDEPIDLVITLTRYSSWSGSAAATHGSPYDQDASVPIVFYGPWVKPGRYTTFARTVDIGVTLAEIAGVKPTERVDGVVLRSAIK